MAGRFDDDWIGTPPEGRHTRDRADPGYWMAQWKPQLVVFGVLGILVLVVLLLALT